jgi:hypothetical protein
VSTVSDVHDDDDDDNDGSGGGGDDDGGKNIAIINCNIVKEGENN